MLGHWVEAFHDLSKSCQLDYDDDANQAMHEVEPRVCHLCSVCIQQCFFCHFVIHISTPTVGIKFATFCVWILLVLGSMNVLLSLWLHC